MQTFSLEICHRIAKVLGDKTPKTPLIWISELADEESGQHREEVILRQDYPGEHWSRKFYVAFTIADLSGLVWQEICRKLGWFSDDGAYNDWEFFATKTYEVWLTGGYPAAEEYLNTILPKV